MNEEPDQATAESGEYDIYALGERLALKIVLQGSVGELGRLVEDGEAWRETLRKAAKEVIATSFSPDLGNTNPALVEIKTVAVQTVDWLIAEPGQERRARH